MAYQAQVKNRHFLEGGVPHRTYALDSPAQLTVRREHVAGLAAQPLGDAKVRVRVLGDVALAGALEVPAHPLPRVLRALGRQPARARTR